MKTWERVNVSRICGQCGARILDGDPVLLIQIPGVIRKLARCQLCAGPAPPDLPRWEAPPQSFTKRFTPARAIANTVTRTWLPRGCD